MEEPRYPCLMCDPPGLAVIGTKKELETHLAEYHHTFYPHHCRTCGYRTYDKRAIYERCVPLKHKVVFWEVREEEEEGQLAIELRACLRNPKPMAPLSTDASPTQFVDTCAPSLVEASSLRPDVAHPPLNEVMEIEVVKTAPPRVETTSLLGVERVPPSALGKPSFKRASKLQVHTTMTCHFTGCGEELVLRGKSGISDVQKRHVQERHLSDEIAIRCLVRGCEQKCNNAYYLSTHLRRSHGGVEGLGADEIASYRALQKRMLDASIHLVPICFPLGAVSRDEGLAKKKSQCTKCEKSIDRSLQSLRSAQKSHVEKDHLNSCEIKCPVSKCTSITATLKSLSAHIRNYHGGRLCEEELVTYRALMQRVHLAGNNLLAECFPDDDDDDDDEE